MYVSFTTTPYTQGPWGGGDMHKCGLQPRHAIYAYGGLDYSLATNRALGTLQSP